MTSHRNPWPPALIALGVFFTAVLGMTMVYGARHRSRVTLSAHHTRDPNTGDDEASTRRGILVGWHLSSGYHEGVLTVRVSDRSGATIEGAEVTVRLLDARGLPEAPRTLSEVRAGTYAGSVTTPGKSVRARVRVERGDTARIVHLLLLR